MASNAARNSEEIPIEEEARVSIDARESHWQNRVLRIDRR
jgi:hypothetical protein